MGWHAIGLGRCVVRGWSKVSEYGGKRSPPVRGMRSNWPGGMDVGGRVEGLGVLSFLQVWLGRRIAMV